MKSKKNWALPFFTIWAGQALSLLGSRVAQFALVWWLTETTDSLFVLPTMTLVVMLPEVFLGPFAGALVDRWDRRKVMMVADSVIALISLGLAVLFWLDRVDLWHIYVVMISRSIGSSFHWPAMQASTTLMVPEEHLTRVSALNQALYGALNIIGPPLGALLFGYLALHELMLVDVATAAFAVIPLFFVKIPHPKRRVTEDDKGPVAALWRDVLEGGRYLLGWKGMLYLLGLAFFFKFSSTPAFSLLPLLVKQYFAGDAWNFSLLQVFLGCGIILGGVTLSIWGGFRKRIVTLLLALIIFSLGFFCIGFAPQDSFWMALVGSFVMGLVMPMIDAPFMAIMQTNIAPEMQGRVFSLIGTLLGIGSLVGLPLAGPLSELLGLKIWYVISGICCCVLGVGGFFLPVIINIEENIRTPEAEPPEKEPI